MHKEKMPDGTFEERELERWTWILVYADGTEKKQFEEDGTFNRFSSSMDGAVRLVAQKTDDPTRVIDLPLVNGMKPFWIYRNFREYVGAELKSHERLYIFGWKMGEQKAYFCIMPDDRIIFGPEDITIDFIQ